MRTLFVLCLAVAAISLAPSCVSSPSEGSGGSEAPFVEGDSGRPEWVDKPRLVTDALAGVGSYKVIANEGLARRSAASLGRAELAACMKARIQSLNEAWAKEAGDLRVERSLSSYTNTEEFVGQYVNRDVSGAVPKEYYLDRKTKMLHCLIYLDAESTAKWLRAANDAVAEQALRDATLWKTEKMKDDARKRMAAWIEKQNSDIDAKRRSILEGAKR